MKNTKLLLVIATSAALLIRCQNTYGTDTDMVISLGLNAYKAAMLSDAGAKAIANQGCAEMGSGNQAAGKPSKYDKRLAEIAKTLGNNISGTPVNYKVYMISDVNAWTMANGCVRVYSSLTNMMNDNKTGGVLGHELGHVALGHPPAEMKASYAIVAACDAISATSGVASQFSHSQLGDIVEGATNAKYSRDKESEADDLSFDLLKKRGISTQGLVGSFEKLASPDGGRTQSMLDSYPPSTKRTRHVRDRIVSGRQIIVTSRAGLLPVRYNCTISPHLNTDKTGSCTQR